MSDEEVPRIVRLAMGDTQVARQLFILLAEVFETDHTELSEAYADRLLEREEFWVYAATLDGELVGGLTAHTLPMTTSERAEVFIFDLAVRASHQRRGIGRRLVQQLIHDAARIGIDVVFVPADDEDTHALDFYRSIGGAASPVTFFTFGPP